MNPIATLQIICTSIHNGGLSEVSVVTAATQCLLLHTNRERGKVGSSESVAAECSVGSCPSCHHLLDTVHSLLHTGLQIPASEYLTPNYGLIKAEPAPITPPVNRPTTTVHPSVLMSQ